MGVPEVVSVHESERANTTSPHHIRRCLLGKGDRWRGGVIGREDLRRAGAFGRRCFGTRLGREQRGPTQVFSANKEANETGVALPRRHPRAARSRPTSGRRLGLRRVGASMANGLRPFALPRSYTAGCFLCTD